MVVEHDTDIIGPGVCVCIKEIIGTVDAGRGSREALGDKERDEVVDTDLGRILEAVVAVGTEEPRAKVFEGGP